MLEEVFTGIARAISPAIEGMRRDLDAEVGFVTVMRFDDLDAVRAFAGEDYEVAVVPPAAWALLTHFDARSAHYEQIADS